MTLSLNRSSRLSIFVMALAYTGLTFGTAIAPAPAAAQGGAYYTATLAQPADDNRAVAGGVAWSCEGTTCTARKGTSRPIKVCRGLHREFGEITSFKAKGKELAEDRLAKCNGN
ncbi:hypothetical protein [Erythrobacter sp. THAF29]|uniref:CC_3452 family protein n=1 Tax=Erythrobacter sp. THAF29 TaxID=2587851 RepID=UPI0012678F85|nr:hypothetical protein [Erythrobacter sp. THAF29]QFT75935.1 hypothetical protein FIU90_00130 [Erythrobacter sp. THAF29]